MMICIDIEDCCIPQELGVILSQLPSLSQLKILHPTIISLSSAFIRSILHYCPNMVSLTITRVSPFANIAPNASFPDVPPSVSTSLRYLDLGDCHNMGTVDLYDLLKDCVNLRLLAVVKQEKGNIDEDKAILAACCPRLRHLYYQHQYTPGPIKPMTAYKEDEDEEQTGSNKGVYLQGLSIHASDAENFMDQHEIKYLRLVHAHLSNTITSAFLPSRLIQQNCNTLKALDLSPSSLDALEVLIPLFSSLINLKRVRIWFEYMDSRSDQAIRVFQQLAKVASQHPTLLFVGLKMAPLSGQSRFSITKGSLLIPAIASIRHLKEIKFLLCHTDSDALKDLFAAATDLQRITLKTQSALDLTTPIFTALARLQLDTLELISCSLERGTLYEAGLRYFVDNCIGPLNTMAIRGNICFNVRGCDIVYAEQKLGKRFKYEYTILPSTI